MKKVFALILAAAMLLCTAAFAEEVEQNIVTLDPAVEMYVHAVHGLRLRSEMDLDDDTNILRVLPLNETVLVDSIIDGVWAHVTYVLPEAEETAAEETAAEETEAEETATEETATEETAVEETAAEETATEETATEETVAEETIEGYMWYDYLGEEELSFTTSSKSDAAEDSRTITVYGAYVLDENGFIQVDDLEQPIVADIEMTKEDYVYYRVMTDEGITNAMEDLDELVESVVKEAEDEFDDIYRDQYFEAHDEYPEEIDEEATIIQMIPVLDENGEIIYGEDGEPVLDEVEFTKEDYVDYIVNASLIEKEEEFLDLVDEVIAKAEAEFDAIYEAQQQGVESSEVRWTEASDEEGEPVEVVEVVVPEEPAEETPVEEPAEEPVVEEPVVEE